MPVESAMQLLGEIDGVKWFWAEPGRFGKPGVYWWDEATQSMVHVTAETERQKPVAIVLRGKNIDTRELKIAGFQVVLVDDPNDVTILRSYSDF